MKNLLKVMMCLAALSPLSVNASSCYNDSCCDSCCFDELYFSVSGGGNWAFNHKPDLDTGWFVGGAIGTHLDCDLRAELSYDYITNNIDTRGDNKEYIHAALINAYYDLCAFNCLTPFVGAGIGYAFVDSDLASSHENHQFGFQVGAGLRYDIDSCMSVAATYRLFGHTRGAGTGYHNLFGITLTRDY